MPARTIPKNYRNVTGIHASVKSEEQAMFESTLERDFITLLEFDNSIISFKVQPVEVKWTDQNGKNRSYFPDMLFKRKTKAGVEEVLVEVKYRSDLKEDWNELKPKLKAGLRYAKQHGWKFKIMTEVEIRTTLLKNAKFLRSFIRRGADREGDMELIDSKLHELKRTTPKALLEKLAYSDWDKAALLPTLWYLVGTRQIGCDLQGEQLNMNTPIYWKP
ncbi:TnsA endonuclease N-terminal domain-containing protein [Hydrogenovibrio sp. JE_KL2]|uniref:TnsA endonuclease N-terminal domain-containing protein n=1 Tax=Hydrogenovibrio sp. JE_KL2 TaxID=2651188 RepID=UPI00128E8649|nr:TnsA endonuclease N-terminal domain-containing protein [Hydrogenovibrio sp. JE_KL2]MPQ76828.1 heteromeric transposase endonuclease subunit TnsA [Hydrogenovibrio sp. JE_KL2]